MRFINEKFLGYNDNGDSVIFADIYGTSSDTKPTSGIAMGSLFVEVDTGKTYLFNEDETTPGNEWVEQNASSGSGGGEG